MALGAGSPLALFHLRGYSSGDGGDMTPKPAWTLAATALCAIPAFAFSTVTPPWGSPVDQKSWGTALFED